MSEYNSFQLPFNKLNDKEESNLSQHYKQRKYKLADRIIASDNDFLEFEEHLQQKQYSQLKNLDFTAMKRRMVNNYRKPKTQVVFQEQVDQSTNFHQKQHEIKEVSKLSQVNNLINSVKLSQIQNLRIQKENVYRQTQNILFQKQYTQIRNRQIITDNDFPVVYGQTVSKIGNQTQKRRYNQRKYLINNSEENQ